MYGLPADFETAFLVGRTLDSIGVQSNVINLSLSGECLISAEGGPSEGNLSFDEGELIDPPTSILHLYPLIDQKIVAASGCIHGKLSLVFEKGQTLHIHDTSERYESYSISLNDKMIVLV